jgi:MFS superfamily sulfate permease-like transporter
VVAADSATAAILAGSLAPLAEPGSAAYLSLAAAVTLLTAAMLLLARLLKLGFLADFLSRTVLAGFLAGVGVQVGVAMLGDMLGIAVTARDAGQRLWQIATGLQNLSAPTLALSGLTVALIVLGKRLAPKAPVALALVIAAILASHALNLQAHGIAVLGPLQTGLPGWHLPRIEWQMLPALLPIAASCFVVILAQSAATVRAFRDHERGDDNGDILGLAAANAATAFGGAFVVNGSPTQTAAAVNAGARSQFAQVVFALTVLAVLLTVAGRLAELPRCVLAGLIFTLAIGLVDWKTLRAMRHESRGEWRLALVTAAVVAGVGVQEGIVLAMVLSLLRHVRHSYHPHTAVLQRAAEGGWQEAPPAAGVQSAPGLIIYRFNADLFYANASHFADQVWHLVEGAPDPVRWLMIEAEAITNLDYSAARTLLDLCRRLKERQVQIVFARVAAPLLRDLERHGVIDAVGRDRVFSTRHKALRLVQA